MVSQIVARLQPKDGSSKIPYQALFDWAANMAPLGSRQMDNGREPAPGATQQHSHDQHGLQGQNGKEPAAAAATQQHSHDQQGRSSGLHGVSSVAAMTASRPQTTPAGVARGNDADAGIRIQYTRLIIQHASHSAHACMQEPQRMSA